MLQQDVTRSSATAQSANGRQSATNDNRLFNSFGTYFKNWTPEKQVLTADQNSFKTPGTTTISGSAGITGNIAVSTDTATTVNPEGSESGSGSATSMSGNVVQTSEGPLPVSSGEQVSATPTGSESGSYQFEVLEVPFSVPVGDDSIVTRVDPQHSPTVTANSGPSKSTQTAVNNPAPVIAESETEQLENNQQTAQNPSSQKTEEQGE